MKNLKLKIIKINTILFILVVFLNFIANINIKFCPVAFASSLKDTNIQRKKVLLINSYDPMFGISAKTLEGLKNSFKDKNIFLDVEYMDSKRFINKEYLENFYNIMKYKIEKSPKYDYVIAADDNAFNFVTENYNSLFENIPVVFLGVNDSSKAFEYSKNPNITGVIEEVSINETVELSKDLNPNLNKIVAIFDKTVSSNIVLKDFKNMLSEFNDINDIPVQILNLRDISFHELEQEIMNISRDSAIILFSAYVDKNNQNYSFDEAIKLISKNSQVPIYYFLEEGINKGALG